MTAHTNTQYTFLSLWLERDGYILHQVLLHSQQKQFTTTIIIKNHCCVSFLVHDLMSLSTTRAIICREQYLGTPTQDKRKKYIAPSLPYNHMQHAMAGLSKAQHNMRPNSRRKYGLTVTLPSPSQMKVWSGLQITHERIIKCLQMAPPITCAIYRNEK